jgi:hypothetical protein
MTVKTMYLTELFSILSTSEGMTVVRIHITASIQTLSDSYLGLPRRAAWCKVLKPLLLVILISAPCSKSNVNMSSRFLLIASWRGVSPSESWCNTERTSCLKTLETLIYNHFPQDTEIIKWTHYTELIHLQTRMASQVTQNFDNPHCDPYWLSRPSHAAGPVPHRCACPPAGVLFLLDLRLLAKQWRNVV